MSDTLRLERKIIALVGAVQFVNILDFMMVMPMGPDFTAALGISSTKIGLIGGAYTAAAALSGIIAAKFLDRFDRRSALAIAMLGLVIATALGGLAWDLNSLVAARVLAGMFGGPATAIGIAIIADNIPPERRGRAMGAVMGAFSVASVLGVPLGLEAARLFGWRMPFFAVAALGLLVLIAAIALLPKQRSHLAQLTKPPRLLTMLLRREYWLAYVLPTTVFLGIFMLIPYIAPHLLQNMGFAREDMWKMYAIGGSLAFVGMRIAGRLTDRYGSAPVMVGGTLVLVVLIEFAFVAPLAILPILVVFPAFMLAGTFRAVPMQTLVSKVPPPHERASFMAIQQSLQHACSAGGAFVASLLLFDLPDGRLGGIDTVGQIAIGLSLLGPIVAILVERQVKARTVLAKA